MTSSFRIAAAALAIAGAAPAWAGSPYNAGTDTPALRGPGNPAASGVPNVPNLQGCVPWCKRDLNPCDPPIYKRVDGRCAFYD